MNSIERITKLSGIYTITEAFGEKKYADRDKAGLQAVKKELQGIMATAARASFKYKTAQEELKVVEACLRKLEEPENKDVKEALDASDHNMEAEQTHIDVNPVCESTIDNADKTPDFKKKDKSDDQKDSDEEVKEDKSVKNELKVEENESQRFDPNLTAEQAKRISDEIQKQFNVKVDLQRHPSGAVVITINNGHLADNSESSNPNVLTMKNLSKLLDNDYYGFRQRGWFFEQPQGGRFSIGVPAQRMRENESVEDIVARILEKDLTPTKVEVDYENGPTENSGIKFEQGTKIRLPAAVKSEVKQRIAELNQAILRYDDKGYDDKSIKQQAVDCLNQILQDLSTNDLEGVKKAQIYFETLMSPLTDFFPPKLINWLANAINPYVGVKESVDDQTEARKKWMAPYQDKLDTIDARFASHVEATYPDPNLQLVAKMAYLEYFTDYIKYVDAMPFVGVRLSDEELAAAKDGLEWAIEDDSEAQSYKARRNSSYRTQDEIDDPMNDPENGW